jgi:hypothetical protein
MAVDAADACRAERDDTAAAEEQAVDLPPEAKPFAVIMRTPGADGELAAGGSLLAERVVRSVDDLRVIECGGRGGAAGTGQGAGSSSHRSGALAPALARRAAVSPASRRRVTTPCRMWPVRPYRRDKPFDQQRQRLKGT